MRKVLLFVLLVLGTLSIHAQERELHPIDWKVIETTTLSMPDSIKSLVSRLSGTKFDPTLTWDERRLAIFGQSILSENKEEDLAYKAIDKYNEEKYIEAIQLAKKALEINPLNVSALNTTRECIMSLIESGDTSFKDSDAELYHNRAYRIYNTIATTGDGSKENPFYVTCVSEEYCFLRFYLNLWEYESQSLVGQCDLFKLKETSKYYPYDTIYFETSRDLDIIQKRNDKAENK